MSHKRAKLGGMAAVLLVGGFIFLLHQLQIQGSGVLTQIGGEGVALVLATFICIYSLSLIHI